MLPKWSRSKRPPPDRRFLFPLSDPPLNVSALKRWLSFSVTNRLFFFYGEDVGRLRRELMVFIPSFSQGCSVRNDIEFEFSVLKTSLQYLLAVQRR